MPRHPAAALLLLLATAAALAALGRAATTSACSRPDVAGRCRVCNPRRGCTSCRPGSVLTAGARNSYATCTPCHAALGCAAGSCSASGCRSCPRGTDRVRKSFALPSRTVQYWACEKPAGVCARPDVLAANCTSCNPVRGCLACPANSLLAPAAISGASVNRPTQYATCVLCTTLLNCPSNGACGADGCQTCASGTRRTAIRVRLPGSTTTTTYFACKKPSSGGGGGLLSGGENQCGMVDGVLAGTCAQGSPNQCCSKEGVCGTECFVQDGCQSAYGVCKQKPCPGFPCLVAPDSVKLPTGDSTSGSTASSGISLPIISGNETKQLFELLSPAALIEAYQQARGQGLCQLANNVAGFMEQYGPNELNRIFRAFIQPPKDGEADLLVARLTYQVLLKAVGLTNKDVLGFLDKIEGVLGNFKIAINPCNFSVGVQLKENVPAGEMLKPEMLVSVSGSLNTVIWTKKASLSSASSEVAGLFDYDMWTPGGMKTVDMNANFLVSGTLKLAILPADLLSSVGIPPGLVEFYLQGDAALMANDDPLGNGPVNGDFQVFAQATVTPGIVIAKVLKIPLDAIAGRSVTRFYVGNTDAFEMMVSVQFKEASLKTMTEKLPVLGGALGVFLDILFPGAMVPQVNVYVGKTMWGFYAETRLAGGVVGSILVPAPLKLIFGLLKLLFPQLPDVLNPGFAVFGRTTPSTSIGLTLYHSKGDLTVYTCFRNSDCPAGGYVCNGIGTNEFKVGFCWKVGCPENKTMNSVVGVDIPVCYPACRAGFKRLFDTCWADCPTGYSTVLGRCEGSCQHYASENRTSLEGGFCYPSCRSGFEPGLLPGECLSTCPAAYNELAGTCIADNKLKGCCCLSVLGNDLNNCCPKDNKCATFGPAYKDNGRCLCVPDGPAIIKRDQYFRGLGKFSGYDRNKYKLDGELAKVILPPRPVGSQWG